MRKPGQKTGTEDSSSDDLTKITFKVDEPTLRALEALEKRAGGTVRRQRSNLLRKLIMNAYERILKEVP